MNATLTNHLEGWTTDELLVEVLKRSAGSRRALDFVQATTLRALLQECDRKVEAGLVPQSR